ncbi:MAG: bifunctional SulP family inorganic anion transporter/carbonic anhydrase [Verrucomicrobiales bacterium]|nr:bifunctional SulP family inorganic anion transporter/carbonic anhydrase [Verrucomicrobiales bacterium]
MRTPLPKNFIVKDLIAGLVVFLVAVPLCLGIAHASGVPIIAGLLAGIIGGLVVGTISGAQISVSGPAAGLTAIVLTQMERLGSFDAFLLALFFSGLFQIAFGIFRAGLLANYFPNNVIKGLLGAIGVILIMKQLPHLVGHDPDYEGDMSFSQMDGENTLSEIFIAFQRFLPGAAIIGISCLVLLILWDKSRLKKSIFPAPLAAVLLGVAINEILRVSGSSLAIAPSHLVQVPVLGEGVGWDQIFHFPDFSAWSNPAIYMGAITIAIVASLETLLNIEATDKLDPYKRFAPQNRELVAQGVGNSLAGLIGGMPVTSVIVRSSVNASAGGVTKLSTIVHGVLLAVSIFFLPEWLNKIPLAALAAILVVTGWKLANPKLFKEMYQEGRNQFLPFVITLGAIVLTDLLIGILIGLAVSLLFILYSNLRRGFHVVQENHVGGSVTRLVFANQVSFLNRAQLATTLAEFGSGDQVILDARTTDYIDPDILSVIREFRDDQAPVRGAKVSLMGFKDRYPIGDEIQYVDVSTRDVQAAMTPEKVLRLLKEGNERFVSGERLNRDLVRQVDATSDGQHPLAVVLACIDSRIATEMIFDLGLGDIFSCRVAGNIAGTKMLGSMEFACKVAGAKLIVVLGHTRCGAVKAACDLVESEVDPAAATGLPNLGALTGPLGQAIRQETTITEDRNGSNEAFVNRVAALNVGEVMSYIRTNSSALREVLDEGSVRLVGGMYDVRTGKVEFYEDEGVKG